MRASSWSWVVGCGASVLLWASGATADDSPQIRSWEESARAWEEASETWRGELSRKEAALQKARDAIDIDARAEAIERGAKEIAKMGAKGIGESLSGKREKAGITATRMVKEYAAMKEAEGEIIDIAADTARQARVAALQKEVAALQTNVSVAGRAVAISRERAAALSKAASEAAWREFFNNLSKSVDGARDRKDAARRAAEGKSGSSGRDRDSDHGSPGRDRDRTPHGGNDDKGKDKGPDKGNDKDKGKDKGNDKGPDIHIT